MSNITYKENKEVDISEAKKLYADAGWEAYTKNLDMLKKSIENSAYVATAWVDNELVGLIRVITDYHSIVYVQDILVKKAYRRRGIASKLLNMSVEKFRDIRQKVLITEDKEETINFYESNKFMKTIEKNIISFIRLDDKK